MTSVYDLAPNDHAHGHRRVYDPASVRQQVEAAGFEIEEIDSIFLKLLSDVQFDQFYASGFLNEQHIRVLSTMGRRFPHLCGSICALARG
jgi:hypothetical protein